MKSSLYFSAVVVLSGSCMVSTVLAEDLTPEQHLGKLLFQDKDLSFRHNQSCETCHALTPTKPVRQWAQTPGFVDSENVLRGTAVSEGSVKGKSGTLNTPSVAYAAFSPDFHWDAVESLFVGGQFWNGRSSTLADQAGQPFLNALEMAMPDRASVLGRIKGKPAYQRRFKTLYGVDLRLLDTRKGATSAVNEAYGYLTKAIAEFERTREFSRFTSKYDFYLAKMTRLSEQEERGRVLFEGKALCSACHVDTPETDEWGQLQPPLLTDYTYDNIGVPRNVTIPGNPEPDPGLAGNPAVMALGEDRVAQELGKHKVMSLRNIAITPPYGHNGVFRTLEQIVHFYNTRDTLGTVCSDNDDPGFASTCWPAPEVAANVNTDELGNLGLALEEEADLVAFLKTLTDGYPRWGHDPNVKPGTPSPFSNVPLSDLP